MDDLRIRYDDGYSGTFYKTFHPAQYKAVTLASSLLAHVLPWDVFDAWLCDDNKIYISGFGEITKETKAEDVLNKVDGRIWFIYVIPCE